MVSSEENGVWGTLAGGCRRQGDIPAGAPQGTGSWRRPAPGKAEQRRRAGKRSLPRASTRAPLLGQGALSLVVCGRRTDVHREMEPMRLQTLSLKTAKSGRRLAVGS